MLQPIQSMRLYRFVTSGQQPYPHWWFPSMEEVFFPTTGGKPRAILPLVSHLSHQFRKKCSAITSTSTESSNSMFLSWTLIALAVNSLHLVPGWHSTLWSRNLFCGSNMNGDIQTGRATVFFPEYPFTAVSFYHSGFQNCTKTFIMTLWNCTGPV